MKIKKTGRMIYYFATNWRVERFYNFFIYVYEMIYSKNLWISVTHLWYHWHKHFVAKKYTNEMQKNIHCYNQIIDLKNKKIYPAKINNTCIRIKSSSCRSCFLWPKDSLCLNIWTSWWLLLFYILNLFLNKKNWYLKKHEIHCFFHRDLMACEM